jgi:hypothetical protein
MNNDIISMARKSGVIIDSPYVVPYDNMQLALERFAELVRADAIAKEREACARKTEEFARKWWKIHCDSNLHYSSTLKAHQDFCALQAAIRARGNT